MNHGFKFRFITRQQCAVTLLWRSFRVQFPIQTKETLVRCSMEYHVFSTIFLHVILLMKFAATQDTCTPSSIPYSGNPPLPKLPDGFSMFVVTANVTSSAQVGKQLYVDAKRKLATVGEKGIKIYDYRNAFHVDKFLSVEPLEDTTV